MHQLPIVTEPKSMRHLPPSNAPVTASEPLRSRFGASDYVRYGAKLARGILSSRVFGHHRPLLVNFETTRRCNLNCVYCDKSNDGSPDMDTVAAIRVIDELAAIGTLSICFDGGEPLLHPDIEQFVRRAKTHGMRVSMSTNGILIPRQSNVLRFVDKVKVSVDGPPLIHDAGRRKGSFAGAVEGVRIAAKAGCSVAIRMTLGDHNVRHYRDVLAIAKELQVKALFQPAVGSVMNNANAPKAHSANIATYRAAIDHLVRLKARGEPVANETLCLRHLRNWPDPIPTSLCSGGRVEVAIGPDGDLFPCGRRGRHLHAPNVFSMGVADAFRQLSRPTDCANCWCALTLAGCHLYRGDIRMLTGTLGARKSPNNAPPGPSDCTPAINTAR